MKPTTTASIKILALATALLFPIFAFASVDITEVMYDAPGNDSGHEWIEIANTGDAPVDTHGYKLFEGGVNHGISVAVGTSTMSAGEVAIIADNTQTFLQDFPNYTGSLFKSSFSLSNTGEDIVLKDAKLNAVSSITYSSTSGAAGDGNSLHKNGDAWIAGAPNPGSLAPVAAISKVSASAAPVAAPKKSSASQPTAAKTPGLSPHDTQTVAVADTGMPLQMPALPQEDSLWTSVLGLAALVVVGVGGALYVRNSPPTLTSRETAPLADEFEIE